MNVWTNSRRSSRIAVVAVVVVVCAYVAYDIVATVERTVSVRAADARKLASKEVRAHVPGGTIVKWQCGGATVSVSLATTAYCAGWVDFRGSREWYRYALSTKDGEGFSLKLSDVDGETIQYGIASRYDYDADVVCPTWMAVDREGSCRVARRDTTRDVKVTPIVDRDYHTQLK